MLSDQQESGSLSRLPSSPQPADSVSAAALKGSFPSSKSAATSTSSSSAHTLTSSVAATPAPLSSPSCRNSSALPAASGTCVPPLQRSALIAASLAIQRCATASAVSCPLQPTATVATGDSSVFIANTPTCSNGICSPESPQKATSTSCPAHATTSSLGSSFWISRYKSGPLPEPYARKVGIDISATYETAVAGVCNPGEYSAVPPSEYNTAPVYSAAFKGDTFPSAIEYSAAIGYAGLAPDYDSGGTAAPKYNAASTSSVAASGHTLEQYQEVWQRPRHFSHPHCQPYHGEVCAQEQQQYLLQPPLQKQGLQLTSLDERCDQVQQEEQQHTPSSLNSHLQQRHHSLPTDQQRISQVLEQENALQAEQHLQQLSEEDSSDLNVSAETTVELSKRAKTTGFDSRCTPQRHNATSTGCLYASQTTASSLSASCLSAQSYSVTGSPSTRNTHQACHGRRTTIFTQDYDVPVNAAAPVPSISLDPAQDSWSSLQESPRWLSTSDTHSLGKPGAGAVVAATASSVQDCRDTSASLSMLNSVPSSRTTRIAETRSATTAASTVRTADTSFFAERGTSAGAPIPTMVRDAPTTTQTGLSFGESTVYQISHSRSSGTGTTTSFAEQQQRQQTRLSFAAGACSAATTTQTLMLQQQLQPPAVQQHHSRQSSSQLQTLQNPTQSHRLLHQQQQYQQQQHVGARQRLQAHQCLLQQEQLQQVQPPQVHQNVSMQQAALEGRQQHLAFDPHQSEQQRQTLRQPQNRHQLLYPPRELPQQNRELHLQQQPTKPHFQQLPRLSMQHHNIQPPQDSGSHYLYQQQNTSTAVPNAGYSCTASQISPLRAAVDSMAASFQPSTPSMASANYDVADASRVGGDSSREDSSNFSSSAHITPEEDCTSSAYVQSQQLSQQQQPPPQQVQQQQLLHFQQQLHLDDQQHSLGEGDLNDVGLPATHDSLSGGPPVLKQPLRQQQQHVVQPGPQGSQQAFYVQQPCRQGEELQQPCQGNFRTSGLTCQQEDSGVAPANVHVSLCSLRRHPVQPASSVPAVFTSSSTMSSCVRRPCLIAPSLRGNSFSEVAGGSLAAARAATPICSALEPYVPPALLPPESRPAPSPPAAPVSAEDMAAAAGASSCFNAAVPRYSTATDVELLAGCRPSQPNLSFTGGSAASPSCFFSNSADRPPNYIGYKSSSNTTLSNATSCIPADSQTDTWSLTHPGGSSSTKKGATPQQKGISRRCLQYRHQQQLRTESPTGANTIIHPLRAVRGLPMQQRKLFRNLARQTPRVQGLTFDHNQIRWISYWKNSQGKQIQRHFPVSRFGFIEARRLALEERNKILGWPLDTDEAADAIAELSRTAEQSLQLLLQQSLSTGGGHTDGGTAAALATLGKAAQVLDDVAAEVAGTPAGAAPVRETNAEESLQPIEVGAPIDGSIQRENKGAEDSLSTEAPAAASLAEEEQQLRVAATTGAEEAAAEECYFSTSGSSYSQQMEVATGATGAAATPAAEALPTAAEGSEEAQALEEMRQPSSAAAASVGEALKSTHVTSTGEYQICTYGCQEEITTEVLEEREVSLQFQRHRASVISVSTTDQERTCEGGGSNVASNIPQACSYTVICPSASYSAVAAGNAPPAACTYEDVQQRDRSAASTNVGEDAEGGSTRLETHAHPAKQQRQQQQQQQGWPLCYTQQQQQSPVDACAGGSNLELHPEDITSQHDSQQQQQLQLQQPPHERAFQQQPWPQPLQQENLQGSVGTTVERILTCSPCSKTPNDALMSAAASETRDAATEQQTRRRPYSRSAEQVYEANPSPRRHLQQQGYELHASSPPLQQEQQLLLFLQRQQPSDNYSDDSQKPWSGQRQAQLMFNQQEQTPFCRAPTAAGASIHVAERPAVHAPTAAAASGFPTDSGIKSTPAPTTAAASGGVAAGAADAAAVRATKTAACTPARSRQQPRQRDRSRKKNSEIPGLSNDLQDSPAPATTALAPKERTGTAAPRAARAEGTGLLPGEWLPSVREELSPAPREAAATRLAGMGETQVPSEGLYFAAEASQVENGAAAAPLVKVQQVVQLPAAGCLSHILPDSQTSCCTRGTAAGFTIEEDLTSASNVNSSGVCAENSGCQQLQQQDALHNSQTLSWNCAESCADWKQWQYQGQQQQGGVHKQEQQGGVQQQEQQGGVQQQEQQGGVQQQGQQLATQGFPHVEEDERHLLQHQTYPRNLPEKTCMSQQQQPSQGRQKKQQRTSSKKKTMTQQSSRLDASFSTSAQGQTATPDAATAAVAAAAATATAAAVAAATATAAAAVSSSLKRKKSMEQGPESKRVQSRKTRRKCKPDEQQHALFSAAAAAARQAVDTLPEPIIHPQLLHRRFPQSALLQYVQPPQQQQPFRLQSFHQEQQGNQQHTQQRSNNSEKLLLGDSTSQLQPQEQLHCQQQWQQAHLGLQQPLLPLADLSSEGNKRRSLVPTPPQTPSGAAPFDFSADSSRSNSCYRNALGSCCINSTSRLHISNSSVHNSSNSADNSSHSTCNWHSTTSSSTPKTFSSRHPTHIANSSSINDGNGTRVSYTSCSRACVLSTHQQPYCSSYGDSNSDNCSRSNRSSSGREESWFDNAPTTTDMVVVSEHCCSEAEVSSAAPRSLSQQPAAGEGVAVAAQTAVVIPCVPGAPGKHITSTTGTLHSSPVQSEAHSPYVCECNCNDNSRSVADSGFSVLPPQCSKENEINLMAVPPRAGRSIDCSIRNTKDRSGGQQRQGGKRETRKRDLQREHQRQRQQRQGSEKRDRRAECITAEPQQQIQRKPVQSQQQPSEKLQMLRQPEQQQQLERLQEGLTQQRAAKGTMESSSFLCIGQSIEANGIPGEQPREGQIHEKTASVSGQACSHSRPAQQQHRMSFAPEALLASPTGDCAGRMSTEDACSHISSSRSGCSADSAAVSGSTRSTPADTCDAGTARAAAARDAAPVEAIATSMDMKDSCSSTPIDSSSLSREFPSGSCWWKESSRTTDTCAAASNSECYTSLCMQQQLSSTPERQAPADAPMDVQRNKTGSESTQDHMLKPASTRPPCSASCTPQHYAGQQPSNRCFGEEEVFCIQSCPAKVCCRGSLPRRPIEMEDSLSSDLCQQKQQQELRQQSGSSRRKNSLFYTAEDMKQFGCHGASSAGPEEQTEQQLLQQCWSPCCGSSSNTCKQEQHLYVLSQPRQSLLTRPFEQNQQERSQQEEQQQEGQQQHCSSTRQFFSQQPGEAETSGLPPILSQTSRAGDTLQTQRKSSFLSCSSFSSKIKKYGIETTETLTSSPCTAQLSSPCGGRRSQSGSTKDHLHVLKSCWEGVHNGRGHVSPQKQQGTGRTHSAATVTVAAASALPTEPTPRTVCAAEPGLQNYLQASGDFFQLLPSPRRPSCDWLACDSSNFHTLQPGRSRSSTLPHAAADTSLTSPSSTSSGALTSAATAAAASETYGASAAGTAAPTRAATAATSSVESSTAPGVFSASTAAGEAKRHSIHSIASSSASDQPQQHSVSAPWLLGPRGYLTPAAQSLSSVSAAAQHQQQLSPLWTATVPLPALFRTTASSSIDSFSSLPYAAGGSRRSAAAATPADAAAAAAAEIAAGTESVSHCSSSSSSRLCGPARTKTDLPTAGSISMDDMKTRMPSGTELRRVSTHVSKKFLSAAGEAKNPPAAADNSGDSPPTTTTDKQEGRGLQSSSNCRRTCFAHLLSPAERAFCRPSSHMSGHSLLRSCTVESETLLLGSCRAITPTASLEAAAAAAPFAAAAAAHTSSAAEGQIAEASTGETATPAGRQKLNKRRESSLGVLRRRRVSRGSMEEEGLKLPTGTCSNDTPPAAGEVIETKDAPAAVGIEADVSTAQTVAVERIRSRTSTGDRVAKEALREDRRRPLQLTGAVWRSTTATNDAADGMEEASSFFGSSSTWPLSEKVDAFPTPSGRCLDSHKEQQPTVASSTRPLGTAATDVHGDTAYERQESHLCTTTLARETERVKATALASCPLAAEDTSSTAAGAGTQQNFAPKQLLLCSPLFGAQERSSDDFLQRREHSLPPAVGAAAPWTTAGAAAAGTSWTATAAGERGWSPLLSFAAVPPSPVDARGRFLRLSSPRFGVLAPLSATAATTCSSSSSSTTEGDAGTPFGFLLHDRSLGTPSSSEGTNSTHEKTLPQHIHSDV